MNRQLSFQQRTGYVWVMWGKKMRAEGKSRQYIFGSFQDWMRRVVLIVFSAAAVWYIAANWETLAQFRVTHWEWLPVLAGLQIAFVAVNGLSFNVLLEIFSVRLRPAEWFGLAVATTLGSYLASSVGGMALRAAVLKHKFAVSYTQFASLLTASYILNAGLAAVLGLGACGVLYAQSGLWRQDLLVFFCTIGGLALALVVFRPSFQGATGPVRTLVKGIYEGWDALSRSPGVLVKVGLLLTLNFLLQAGMLIAGFALFAIPLPTAPALLMAALLSFAILFSLTPANLGIQEALMAFLSHLVGYSFQQGLAVAVVSRIISMMAVVAVSPFSSQYLLGKSSWAANSETH